MSDKNSGLFETEKGKDDDILQLIGYAAVALFVGVGIFFILPALLLSLILSFVLGKFFKQKTAYLLSALSFIAFVVMIYFWGIQPLFQFGSLWRSLLPGVVSFIENFVQNGQPFTISNQSVLMLISVSLILASAWLFIAKRLNRNWFTREKEQAREEYLASDQYKQLEKKKVKALNKIQKDYRKTFNESICPGMDIKGNPVVFSKKDLFTHCLVQGTTGTGKTYVMYNLMEGALRNDMGVIFVDGKGDPKTVKEIETIAAHYQKDVYVFSDSTNWHYNPVKYGKATSITDRLMAVMDWSEQFYQKESENLLQLIITFIKDYRSIEIERGYSTFSDRPIRDDLETIHRFLDLTEIAGYLSKEQDDFLKNQGSVSSENSDMFSKDSGQSESFEEPQVFVHYMKLFFQKTNLTLRDLDEIRESRDIQSNLVRGLRTQLELLIYSDLGTKFQEVPGETLDIKEIIKNGDIVVFSLDSNNYSSFIGTIGRFIIADCAYVTTELYGNTDGFKGVLGVFDEFGSYGNDNIVDILSKARSALFGAVLGIQSVSDLQNKRKNIDIKEQTIDNCNMFIVGRSNSPKNAEEIAMLIGTYKDIDRTVMTENIGGRLTRFETKGERGTVRKVNKFEFSPDEIKYLPNYEFFYVNKNIEENNKKKIFSRNVFEGLSVK